MAPPDSELSIYVERMIRMIQLLRIYELVLTLPDEQDGVRTPDLTLKATMMGVVYSFYYSLIEDDLRGVNFFRIWRAREPSFAAELDALEAKVKPFKEKLGIFRNRYGFHGSRSRKHEVAAFALLEQHAGMDVYEAILATRSLSSKLLEAHVQHRRIPKTPPHEAN